MNTLQFRNYLASAASICQHLHGIPEAFVTGAVVRAWELGGLFAPQCRHDGTITRMWVNVIAHQAAVARVGMGLARTMRSVGDLKNGDWGNIVVACLVHDAYKRREQEERDRAIEDHEDVAAAMRVHEASFESFLIDAGVGEIAARLASYTGNRGLEHIRAGQTSLAEKIVFYADCSVSDDQIVGYKKRFDALLPHFEPGGRYETEQAAYRERYGRTHREVWDETVLPLQDELTKLIGKLIGHRIHSNNLARFASSARNLVADL